MRFPSSSRRRSMSSTSSMASQEPQSEKKFWCTFHRCGKGFTRSEHLHRHSSNHKVTPFVCARCNTYFSRRDLLDRHTRRHEEKDIEAGGPGLGELKTRKRQWRDENGNIIHGKRPPHLQERGGRSKQSSDPATGKNTSRPTRELNAAQLRRAARTTKAAAANRSSKARAGPRTNTPTPLNINTSASIHYHNPNLYYPTPTTATHPNPSSWHSFPPQFSSSTPDTFSPFSALPNSNPSPFHRFTPSRTPSPYTSISPYTASSYHSTSSSASPMAYSYQTFMGAPTAGQHEFPPPQRTMSGTPGLINAIEGGIGAMQGAAATAPGFDYFGRAGGEVRGYPPLEETAPHLSNPSWRLAPKVEAEAEIEVDFEMFDPMERVGGAFEGFGGLGGAFGFGKK